MSLQDRYDALKEKGFTLDMRGIYPQLNLPHHQAALSFLTVEEALSYGEEWLKRD